MRRKETARGSLSRYLTLLLLAATLAAPVLATGCAGQMRVYDPYDPAYHRWEGEAPYYNQWEHDTHRQHRDFNKRNDADKKAYWDWRQSHH